MTKEEDSFVIQWYAVVIPMELFFGGGEEASVSQ